MIGTIKWIEICGFRAFAKPQRLDFASSLALISGPNSHGKTSIIEAIEFLLCGETLRREFLGGAKAEFEATLRNAHLPADAPVWVKAGFVGADGAVHEIERKLTKDYAAEGDCAASRVVGVGAGRELLAESARPSAARSRRRGRDPSSCKDLGIGRPLSPRAPVEPKHPYMSTHLAGSRP